MLRHEWPCSSALSNVLCHTTAVPAAGRAGRREQASLAIYVAFDSPLDQHFMAHPEQLFARPVECVQVRCPCKQLAGTNKSAARKQCLLLPMFAEWLASSKNAHRRTCRRTDAQFEVPLMGCLPHFHSKADPENVLLMAQHTLCAAAEIPVEWTGEGVIVRPASTLAASCHCYSAQLLCWHSL